MTITEIRQLLESPYNQKEWKVFLQSHFTNGKLFGDAHSIELMDKTISKKCYSLGNYEVNEYTKIGIFEVQLNDNVKLTRNRVGLRNLIKSITQQVAGAMVVFVQGDKWRFSYISKRKVKNKETDTIEDKETAPKRYTYLFGKNEKALTAAIRFDKLIQKQQGNIFQFLTLNDFEEAFSVEKLSKDFFNEYKKSYEDFVEFITGKRYVKKGNKFVETVIHPANFQLRNLFGNDEKQARDFCKRMMGRIVFLYFIQKKGWLAVAQGKKWGEGNQNYLFDLFKNSKHKDDFYSQELVPLFFKTLNNTASEKATNTLRFPYLNGGLFDDSHDRKFNKLAMPTEIFENLFNTFNNFNFTIYEDAPDEHTVAVDPEMLGHIFENLLEDNKDKGAFYTPKEIVHYMCRESLKEYLIASDELNIADNQTGKETINKIIQQQELSKEEIVYAEKNAFKIIDALEQVKICDPAIGSGAFPMGILQEIFNAQIYLQELKGFTRKQTEAEIKKHIIEESIYGVDIDAGAVDIARLRFWLSLVVDENEPQPLPNLSFKIVCANTLIPLGKIKNLDMGGTKEIADGLAQVRHDYFNASMEEKTALETKFTSLQKKLLTTAKEWVSKEDAAVYQRLLEFSPFEDTSCTWFDAWWMFGVNDGFDIVIGNPPYVNVEKIDKYIKDNIKYFKTAYQKYDLYVLFYELGLNILRPKGILSFITSNKFLSQGYGLLLRKLFLENKINEIVNFNYDIFDNATVRTCILNLQKINANSNHRIKVIDINSISDADKFASKSYSFINQAVFNETDENNFRINLTEEKIEILKHIDNNSIRVEEICSVNYGLRPSSEKLNLKKEAFIYDTNEENKYKPYFEGKDMGYWKIDKSAFIDYQPDVMYNAMFTELFEFEKLVGLRTLSDIHKLRFIYDNEGYYCNDAVVVLSLWHLFEKVEYQTIKRLINSTKINTSNQYEYKYLQAILNSKLIKFYVNELFYDGTHFYPNHMKALPIKKYGKAEQITFTILVDYLHLLSVKNLVQLFPHTTNDRIASHIEDILNMMVFELYFERHMKEVGIDVIQFMKPKPIANAKNNEEKAEIVKAFYLWLQTPDNPVRQRINIVDIKSPNILSKINLATQ